MRTVGARVGAGVGVGQTLCTLSALPTKNAALEPVRVWHAGHGIWHLLESSGDGDNLLDRRAKALNVIVPVENVPAHRHHQEANGLP